MSENVWILFTCNDWREHSSMRIVGVFRDPSKLEQAARDKVYQWLSEDESYEEPNVPVNMSTLMLQQIPNLHVEGYQLDLAA